MAQNSGFNFSNFVNDLIENTMDAILISHMNQEKKVLEIIEDLKLTDDQLIEKYNLIEESKLLFDQEPSQDELINYINSYLIEHRETIQNLTDKGIPKTIINTGKLSIKAVISVEQNEISTPTKDINVKKEENPKKEEKVKKEKISEIEKKRQDAITLVKEQLSDQIKLEREPIKPSKTSAIQSTKKTLLQQEISKKLSNKVFEKRIMSTSGIEKTHQIKIQPIKKNSTESDSTIDIVSEITLEFKTVID